MATDETSTRAAHPEHRKYLELKRRVQAWGHELLEDDVWDERGGEHRYYILDPGVRLLTAVIGGTEADVEAWCADRDSGPDGDDESCTASAITRRIRGDIVRLGFDLLTNEQGSDEPVSYFVVKGREVVKAGMSEAELGDWIRWVKADQKGLADFERSRADAAAAPQAADEPQDADRLSDVLALVEQARAIVELLVDNDDASPALHATLTLLKKAEQEGVI